MKTTGSILSVVVLTINTLHASASSSAAIVAAVAKKSRSSKNELDAHHATRFASSSNSSSSSASSSLSSTMAANREKDAKEKQNKGQLESKANGVSIKGLSNTRLYIPVEIWEDKIRLYVPFLHNTIPLFSSAGYELNTNMSPLSVPDYGNRRDGILWPNSNVVIERMQGRDTIVFDRMFCRRLCTIPEAAIGIRGMLKSPDGSKIALTVCIPPQVPGGEINKRITIWNTPVSNTLINSLPYGTQVAWSYDSKKIAFAINDMINIWHFNLVREWRQDFDLPSAQHSTSQSISSIAWSPDGSQIAVARSAGMAQILEVKRSQLLFILEHSIGNATEKKASADLTAVHWNPLGTKIATSSWDGTAKIWDATTGKVLLTLEGHDSGVLALAWSHDETKLATGSHDLTTKIWDTNSGALLFNLVGHSRSVCDVEWDRDDASLIAVSDYGICKKWHFAWQDKSFADFSKGVLTPEQTTLLWRLKDVAGYKNIKLSDSSLKVLDTFHPFIKGSITKMYDINEDDFFRYNYDFVLKILASFKELKPDEPIKIKEILLKRDADSNISVKSLLKVFLSFPFDMQEWLINHYKLADIKELLERACKKFPSEFVRQADGKYRYVEKKK